jgi:hypothetical protein
MKSLSILSQTLTSTSLQLGEVKNSHVAIEGTRKTIPSSVYFVLYRIQEKLGLSLRKALHIFSVPKYAGDILGNMGTYILFQQGCLAHLLKKNTPRHSRILYPILEGRSLKVENIKRNFKGAARL